MPCEADTCVIKSEGIQNTFWGQDILQLIYFLVATGKDIDLFFSLRAGISEQKSAEHAYIGVFEIIPNLPHSPKIMIGVFKMASNTSWLPFLFILVGATRWRMILFSGYLIVG